MGNARGRFPLASGLKATLTDCLVKRISAPNCGRSTALRQASKKVNNFLFQGHCHPSPNGVKTKAPAVFSGTSPSLFHQGGLYKLFSWVKTVYSH